MLRSSCAQQAAPLLMCAPRTTRAYTTYCVTLRRMSQCEAERHNFFAVWVLHTADRFALNIEFTSIGCQYNTPAAAAGAVYSLYWVLLCAFKAVSDANSNPWTYYCPPLSSVSGW